jgi:hypothetical protein
MGTSFQALAAITIDVNRNERHKAKTIVIAGLAEIPGIDLVERGWALDYLQASHGWQGIAMAMAKGMVDWRLTFLGLGFLDGDMCSKAFDEIRS